MIHFFFFSISWLSQQYSYRTKASGIAPAKQTGWPLEKRASPEKSREQRQSAATNSEASKEILEDWPEPAPEDWTWAKK